jgi:hypothetical protein
MRDGGVDDVAGRQADGSVGAARSVRALHVVANRLHQRRARLPDTIGIALEGVGQGAEQRQEATRAAAAAVAWREVGAAEKGFARCGQPDAHRPAAGAGQLLHGAHVDGVDVGTLLAIDLDGDVVTVEEAGDRRVLEGLGLHHVAPVTGRIADRQEHGPAEPPRFGERLVTPGEPVHRVVRVLQQVGAGLQSQPVGEQRPPVAVEVMRARHIGRPAQGNRAGKPRL